MKDVLVIYTSGDRDTVGRQSTIVLALIVVMMAGDRFNDTMGVLVGSSPARQQAGNGLVAVLLAGFTHTRFLQETPSQYDIEIAFNCMYISQSC